MPGEILLYGGSGAFTIAFILFFLISSQGRDDLKPLYTASLRAGFIFLTLAFLLLVYLFLSDDFSVYYVWLYSSRDMPVFYKIAAVWAGQQGTFLLWTWISSLSLLWLQARKERIVLMVFPVVIFLFFLTILSEPFKLMGQFQHVSGTAVNDGAGLDPELLSPWMALHPPITFIAYAAMTVPFAAAVYFLLGKEDRLPLTRKWAQLSWLFFSLGVGLIGGIWTYEAGWGIWTWDASEAGSLIPWLLLTAGLHQKRKDLQAALFIITFISILFAAFIIRSGLWGSVHAFTETSVNYALEAGIILTTVVFIWLIYRNRNRFDLKLSIDTLALGVMVLIAFIVFSGLFIPVWMKISGNEASVGAEFYNLTSYPFVLLLLILLGVCMFGKRAIRPGIVVGILSIILAFIRPSDAYSLLNPASIFYQQSSALTKAYASLSLLSMIPPVVFAFSAVIWRMRRISGISLVHLGAILVFSSGIVATSFASEYSLVFAVEDIGKTKSLGDYDIKLSKFHVEQNPRGNWVQRATVEVYAEGRSTGSTTVSYIRDKTGNYAPAGIIREINRDIFLTFPGLEPLPDTPPVIPLHARVFPLLNIFWLGDILLSIGIILVIIRDK
ncbi:MAG: hypothetical protein FIB08_14630 [Candidatus Methanoperedens sp.]|nr:hypothetical protein [Candidatus Methanoperedens sp.]